MDGKVNYYSIHGNDRDGWTLNVYHMTTDSEGRETGAVTTSATKVQEFSKLKDLLPVVCEDSSIET